MHRGEEKLVVGQSDSTQAPGELPDKLRSRTGSIIYGWPTIVVTDRDHTPKVAPLFAIQIEPEQGPDNQWELHATMEPEFNLAITASGIFDPSITEDISDLLSHGLPFGDADAFGILVGRTADLLGLQILSPLNARILESNIDRKQGIYNAAISVVAEWSGGYTSTLREELRRLQTREDWATTAAAHLLLDGFAQKEDKRPPSEPLASPLVCNQSQEETLERLRRDPLTVVTGPPGTGKTQLVVNAVTNAWLDGDKVLVTSTNNGAVDVAVDRAEKDVSSGLLVRTGNRDVREQVPDRITAALAQAATQRGNQAAARARLKRVTTERIQLMEKLARLDELDVKLLQVVEGQEKLRQALKEAAQTLWTNASPPELSISSHEIEQRASQLLRMEKEKLARLDELDVELLQLAEKQEELRQANRGIHYKDGSAYSAFEFVARPQTPVLLNEHYRCHPHIARWFNKTFYKGELTVLTDVSDVSQRDRAIYWCDIDGAAVRPATGSWLNQAEVEETVKQLRGAIESGYKTVGVVTPFTAQARLIDQRAKTQFGQDFLDDIDFVSGTAHRLQGDERDAVILSSVLSPGMSKSSARWIEKERNLLNVAVSRARRALIVLGHPLMGDLGSPTLASLRVYLRDEVARNEGSGSLSAEFRTDSTSEKILLDAMQLQDLLPYSKLEVEGYELDFALLEQGIKLNIEVDGDQHLDARSQQRRQDITRDRVLANLGWTILRIPAWRCHEEIDSVIEEIRKTQNRLLDEALSPEF